MYTNYYGFSAKPFQLSPDPRFFFGSSGHKRALAYLRYGLSQAEGFIVVTGGIGTGKTTLVRSLFNELDTNNVVAAILETAESLPPTRVAGLVVEHFWRRPFLDHGSTDLVVISNQTILLTVTSTKPTL